MMGVIIPMERIRKKMERKEYIEREATIERLEKLMQLQAPTARAIIEAIPAADVRPVVLCRECKHKGWVQEPEHGKSVDYCRLIERCVDKQFFCAAGEKREES